MTTTLDIDFDLPAWAGPFLRPGRWKSARGGRGSTKSHTFAQIAIARMSNLLPDYPEGSVRIASCRDFNVNLGKSVKVAVELYINKLGLASEYEIYNNWIDHKFNGSKMIFHGVTSNPDSFLSMEDIDVFWMEQAEVLQDEMIKIAPTIRKAGSELWFVWNPHLRTDFCWDRFLLHPQPGDVSVEVNFYDNPWWFPFCRICRTRQDWENRNEPCRLCGGETWPGLWELEETRRIFEETEPSLYPWMYLGKPNDGDAEHQILPYELINACVRAHKLGLAPEHKDASTCDFGFDVAEGGRNKCCTVGRVGPTVEHCDTWPGIPGDLDPAAKRAHQNTEGFHVFRMYYDGSAQMRGPLRRQGVYYTARPVNFGGEVRGKDITFERGRTNGDMFARFNIQMAMAVRLRANRTVRLLNGADVDPRRCLFINPNLPKLEAFLAACTQPIRRLNPTSGKWEMDKRGLSGDGESPDPFDALCMAFVRDCEGGLKAH